jgi:lysophospholipid acyltransferase (LPLAT)-like uncharacterized protein
MIHRLLCRLLFRLAPLFRAYFRTLSLSMHRPDGSKTTVANWVFSNEIYAASERDHFVLVVPTLKTSFTTLIAPGRDGDYPTAVAEGFGHCVVRGSSRRAGRAALYSLVKALRDRPGPAAVAVDGPLGPVGRAKGGVLVCAALSGRPIVPVAAAARRRIDFPRAWSSIYLPLPFTRAVVVCGEPLVVSGSGVDEERSALLDELSARIAAARAEALRLVDDHGARQRALPCEAVRP